MNNWKKNAALFLTSQAVSLFGSSFVSFAIVWFVSVPVHEPAETLQSGKSSMFADMKNGFSYVLSEPALKYLLFSYGLYIFLCVPAVFYAHCM